MYRLFVRHRRCIRHVWTCQKACHYIPKHKRLLQSFENDCYHSCYYQYQGKIRY